MRTHRAVACGLGAGALLATLECRTSCQTIIACTGRAVFTVAGRRVRCAGGGPKKTLKREEEPEE